jgi:hypothetical protein
MPALRPEHLAVAAPVRGAPARRTTRRHTLPRRTPWITNHKDRHTLSPEVTRRRVTHLRGRANPHRHRCMGRRTRRRTTHQAEQPRRPASRIARVRVDDATWAAFRSAIGDRSVAEVLARYVELEVARAERHAVSHHAVTERELVDALERARTTSRTLQHIMWRLEARLPPGD